MPFPRKREDRDSEDPLVRFPQLEAQPLPLPERTPAPLSALIEACLAKDPARRPAAADLVVELEPLVEDLPRKLTFGRLGSQSERTQGTGRETRGDSDAGNSKTGKKTLADTDGDGSNSRSGRGTDAGSDSATNSGASGQDNSNGSNGTFSRGSIGSVSDGDGDSVSNGGGDSVSAT